MAARRCHRRLCAKMLGLVATPIRWTFCCGGIEYGDILSPELPCAYPRGAQRSLFCYCSRRCRGRLSALQALPTGVGCVHAGMGLGSPHVARALRLIDEGFLNDQSVAALASRLDLSERHLGRMFEQRLGVSPRAIARFKRLQMARQLLSTELPLVQVAAHAGYGSASQFNREIRKFYHCTPSALRRGRGSTRAPQVMTLSLPLRQPYNFDWAFDYLSTRAMEGIEAVQGHRYVRQLPDHQGSVVVAREGQQLRVQLPLGVESIYTLVRRVVRVFDLDADSVTIDTHLQRDGSWRPGSKGWWSARARSMGWL